MHNYDAQQHRAGQIISSLTLQTAQSKDLEVILMVIIKARHQVEGPFESKFPVICNHLQSYDGLKSQDLDFVKQFLRFILGKTAPYGRIFKILFRTFSLPHR